MTPTPTQALKPCPHDGHEAKFERQQFDHPPKHWVKCSYCGASTDVYSSPDSARRAWNQRHRQSSNAASVGVEVRDVLERCAAGLEGLSAQNAADPLLQDWADALAETARAALASLSPTAEPMVLADLVVQLSAIRTVLREAHFALDDSEDQSHLDPPVHAVPLDNVMRLHRALKACERFAPKDEAWEGPGPLVTQIIEQLGHHLNSSTVLRAALEDIRDPIAALRRYANGQGRQLDGAVAFQLSNDPNHLKGIARAALASLSTPTAEPAGGDDEQPGDYLRDNLLNIAAICEAKGLLVEASSLRDTAAIVSDQLRRSPSPLSDLHPLGQEYDRDALREALDGLEWTEDGYSLRTPYDGDADGDGRSIIVGGETVLTFDDSDVADTYRIRFMDALSATPPAQEGEGDA